MAYIRHFRPRKVKSVNLYKDLMRKHNKVDENQES